MQLVYLTIIPRARVRYDMIDSQRGAYSLVGYNHPIFNKREWNNCFIKKQTRNIAGFWLIYQGGKANQIVGIALYNNPVFNDNY